MPLRSRAYRVASRVLQVNVVNEILTVFACSLTLSYGDPSHRAGNLMSTFNLDLPDNTKDFRGAMLVLLDEHRPSRMPFFRRVASLPFRIASDPDLLGEIYLVYQAAMHATRAACVLSALSR